MEPIRGCVRKNSLICMFGVHHFYFPIVWRQQWGNGIFCYALNWHKLSFLYLHSLKHLPTLDYCKHFTSVSHEIAKETEVTSCIMQTTPSKSHAHQRLTEIEHSIAEDCWNLLSSVSNFRPPPPKKGMSQLPARIALKTWIWSH